MGFLVVEFSSNPKQFAVISIDKLVDGDLRALKTKLVGKTVDVLWGRKQYSVKVQGFGTKTDTERLCNNLAEAAANEVPDEDISDNTEKLQIVSSPAGRITSILSKRKALNVAGPSTKIMVTKQVEIIGPGTNDQENLVALGNLQPNPALSPPNEINEDPVEDPSDTIAKLTSKVEKLKDAVRKYKERSKELDSKLSELKNQPSLAASQNNVEIIEGSGVYLEKGVLAAAKLTSKTPTILARTLFRQLFKHEEMRGHSLFGRACNANKSAEVLPSVDGNKRDALIEYCLNAYNLKPTSIGCKRGQVSEYIVQRTRIVDSLNKLLREENCKGN